MKVRDILNTKGGTTYRISPEATVREAMNEINSKKIGALLVEAEGTLQGIVTERDIFRLLHKHADESNRAFNSRIKDVMTTNVVIGLLDDDIDMVEALMTNNRFRHLPIMDGKKIAGIISIGDVVKTLAKNLQIENRYLKDYITGKYPG